MVISNSSAKISARERAESLALRFKAQEHSWYPSDLENRGHFRMLARYRLTSFRLALRSLPLVTKRCGKTVPGCSRIGDHLPSSRQRTPGSCGLRNSAEIHGGLTLSFRPLTTKTAAPVGGGRIGKGTTWAPPYRPRLNGRFRRSEPQRARPATAPSSPDAARSCCSCHRRRLTAPASGSANQI